jgi:RNA polymerase sigma-70 factor (ECF subfamily)
MTQHHQGELEDLYERVRPRLRMTASRYVGWDDAEDVVQDAFVRALASPGAFRHDASITTWMTRIVLNAAIDETRRRKRRPATVASPDLAGLRCGQTPHYPAVELKAALAASSRGDRAILVLAGLLGFSYKETAQRLGLTVGTTKSRLCSARARLRGSISRA